MNGSDELKDMLNQLSLHFAQVTLRGQGRSCFLFAQHNGRAVEISANEDKWWLEFWEVDPDLDAPPVKEMTVETCQEAVKEAADWLAWGPGQTVLANAQRGIPQE